MNKVAIIDDEENILKALRRALSREKWEIQVFNSPNEAFEALKLESVDLILTDYKMPYMSGVELLKKIAPYQPDAIKIILSGQADLEGLMEAINTVGIYRFILKPWNDDELKFTLHQALKHSKLERENKELLRTVKQQQETIIDQLSELKRLEKESPGITQIKLDKDGSIDLSAEYSDD